MNARRSTNRRRCRRRRRHVHRRDASRSRRSGRHRRRRRVRLGGFDGCRFDARARRARRRAVSRPTPSSRRFKTRCARWFWNARRRRRGTAKCPPRRRVAWRFNPSPTVVSSFGTPSPTSARDNRPPSASARRVCRTSPAGLLPSSFASWRWTRAKRRARTSRPPRWRWRRPACSGRSCDTEASAERADEDSSRRSKRSRRAPRIGPPSRRAREEKTGTILRVRVALNPTEERSFEHTREGTRRDERGTVVRRRERMMKTRGARVTRGARRDLGYVRRVRRRASYASVRVARLRDYTSHASTSPTCLAPLDHLVTIRRTVLTPRSVPRRGKGWRRPRRGTRPRRTRLWTARFARPGSA